MNDEGGKIVEQPQGAEDSFDRRVHLWLAPFKNQAEKAFDSLIAAFEDDEVAEDLKPVLAHLLIGLAGTLGRQALIHPGILELARPKTVPDGAEIPTNPFQGLLYTFDGATPADAPPADDWRLQAVRTDEHPSRALYKYRYNSNNGISHSTDRRFVVWIGGTHA